jgi:hypothetical protein
MMSKGRNRLRPKYTMQATVISSGQTIEWVALDEPDYGAMQCEIAVPNTLSNVRVKGGAARRAAG